MKKKGVKKNTIRNTKVFDLYCVWYSLPTMWKGEAEQALRKVGIMDQEVIDLLAMKYQADFVRKYRVKSNTLSRWNKLIQDKGGPKAFRSDWTQHWMSNVFAAVYKKAIVEGDPARAKFLAQIFEDWVEKQSVLVESKDMKDIAATMRDIAARVPKILP